MRTITKTGLLDLVYELSLSEGQQEVLKLQSWDLLVDCPATVLLDHIMILDFE
jgi:hypothetical protein